MPENEAGSPDIAPAGVRLPPDFTRSHRQVIHRYLRSQDPLSSDDWSLLIQAMDLLRRAEIVQGRKTDV